MGAKIAYVSNVDYGKGMVRVAYAGSDKVSKNIPYIANGEYRMPKKGEQVCVIEGDGGTVALGTMHNEMNPPEKSGKGIYYKSFNDRCAVTATENDIIFELGEKSVALSKVAGLLEGD